MRQFADMSDDLLLGWLRAVRSANRTHARTHGRRNVAFSAEVRDIKRECRRRGLVAECRAAKPRFPRAGV